MYATEEERRNFHWAYAALVALAKMCLAEANREREGERNWPAGQTWDELNGSSRSIFMQQAREKAGIPRDEFLALVQHDYTNDDVLDRLWDNGPVELPPLWFTQELKLAARKDAATNEGRPDEDRGKHYARGQMHVFDVTEKVNWLGRLLLGSQINGYGVASQGNSPTSVHLDVETPETGPRPRPRYRLDIGVHQDEVQVRMYFEDDEYDLALSLGLKPEDKLP
jgi:hypothetical protein